jgi:hypothetical protein
MQTLPSQIESSQKRLRADGLHFLEQTRGAASGFANRTLSAGQAFLSETREAATALRGEANEAGEHLLGATRNEAHQWASFVSTKRAAALGELRLALLPGGVERRVLAGLMVSLDGIEHRVEVRLSELEKRASLPAAAPAKAPLRGYDELTAKQVVARIAKLPQASLETLIAYEQANKSRATVLKAAKARLS